MLRQWGVKADGVTDDAPPVARALTWLAGATEPKELIFPEGTLAILSSQAPSTFGPNHTSTTFHYQGRSAVWSLAAFSGDLTIKGAGKDRTKLVMPQPRTLWDCYLGAQNLNLVMQDFTMEYTGGSSSNPVSNYAAGIVCAANTAGSHVNSLRVLRCGINNFMPGIVGNFSGVLLEVDSSDFLYKHGRASYSTAPEDNSPGTAIIDGCKGMNLFTNNLFNGLLDPTYTGVNPGLAPKQLVPPDNFIHNFIGGIHIITGNRVYNSNIEGIIVGTHPLGDVNATNRNAQVKIMDNVIGGTAPQSPAYYHGVRPGIKVPDRQSVIVSGNAISNQVSAIELVGSGPGVVVENNTMTDNFNGVFLFGCDGTIVRHNFFRAKLNATALEKSNGFMQGRFGIYAHNGSRNCLFQGNTINGEKDQGWHATSVVAEQTGSTVNTAGRIYLTSVSGWSVGHWAYLDKANPDGIFHHSPVLAVGANYIDIDPGWGGYGGVSFGSAAVAGDEVLSTGQVGNIGGDPSTHAGIFIRGGSDGSNNRVIDNTIINHLHGVDRFRYSFQNSASDIIETDTKFVNVAAPRGEGTGTTGASVRIVKDAAELPSASATTAGTVSITNFNRLENMNASTNGSALVTYTATGSPGDAGIELVGYSPTLYSPVAAGDVLEYEIFHASTNPTFNDHLDLGLESAPGIGSGALTDDNVPDQNGLSSQANLASAANGKWYARRIALSGRTGQAIVRVHQRLRFGSTGNYQTFYRNVRITNGTTMKKVFYDGTQKLLGTYLYGNPSAFINTKAQSGYIPLISSPSLPKRVILLDQKLAGVNGGAYPTAQVWVRRDLNTIALDEVGGVTLSNNQVTLPAGTWSCHIVCPGLQIERHKAKLRNVSAGTTIAFGTAAYSRSGYSSSDSVIVGKFVLAAPATLEVQHGATGANSNTFAFGASLGQDWPGQGEAENYTTAEFTRLGVP